MVGILQNYCRGVNKNLLIILLIGSCGLVLSAPQTEAAEDKVAHFIESARELKLADQNAWLNLLHYKINLWGKQESQADDSKFFLSDAGKSDAMAELEANLRGFFQPVESTKQNQHPQCRFPARLQWLNQQLDFKSELPAVECVKFEQWKQQWGATQITLLFPSMYLDNPASMFGHTFIRFDTKGKSHLLSPTLSYAAAHDQTDSLLVFSFKGIFGGYAGRFSMQPYYETLREYSDIEQRDIWEYELNLSLQETEQLVRHLWEVSDVHFQYFFFRENCAFRLLALLDVAREGIDMSLYSHPFYAIPVDTVRDVDTAGLIASRKYRPSTHNKIAQMAEQVDDTSRSVSMDIISRRVEAQKLPEQLNTTQKIHSLELANEILNQRKDAENQALQLDVLRARSQLESEERIEFEFSAIPPEQSHASARWQLGAGEYEDQSFIELGFRPSFHDDLDETDGFARGVSISALDLRLRWFEDSEELKFESLNIFSMRSLISVEPWATPVSRKLSLQVNQQLISNQLEEVFEAELGLGFSKSIDEVLFFALADVRLDYATQLEDNFAAYAGIETGVIGSLFPGSLNQGFSVQLLLNYKGLVNLSDRPDLYHLEAGLQVNLSDSQGLRLVYEKLDVHDVEQAQASLSYLFYF